mgnify:CR=1 FL=1
MLERVKQLVRLSSDNIQELQIGKKSQVGFLFVIKLLRVQDLQNAMQNKGTLIFLLKEKKECYLKKSEED